MNRYVTAIILAVLFSMQVSAAPSEFNYTGRIVKADGSPLENASVSFQFEVLNPGATCVLYREQVNGINMVGSGGLFDVRIGQSHSYPSTGTFSLLEAFKNFGSLTCDGGAAYNPLLSDTRVLRVQFYDGSTWRRITPDSIIRSVPYAGFSLSAAKLGDYDAASYILKQAVNGGSNCDGGSFLTWNSTSQTFGCAVASGGGGGTPSGTAAGDLSGTYPNPFVGKLKGYGLDFSSAPTNNQVLTFNGTNWVAADLPATSTGTVTGITAGTGLTGGTITTSGTIGLGTELSALNALSTNGYILKSGAGAYATTAGSSNVGSNNLVLRDGSGVSQFYGVSLNGATSGSMVLQVPAITTNYSLTFPNAQGAANTVLKNNGSGILSWASVPTAPAANCGTGEVITYTGGAFSCVPDQTGTSGTGITSLNGSTSSTQSFGVIGTSGTVPAWSSASGVHTLNIPLASANSVTAGLISKSEYDVFNGKQAALGFTPLNPANNLNDVANVTSARSNLGLGTAATRNVAASGNAATSEIVSGNDSRLSDARTPTGTAGGDLSGTYPSPSVNKLKGYSLDFTTAPTTGKFLKFDGTSWAPSALATGDLPSGIITGTGTSGYVPYFNGAGTVANSVMYQTSNFIGIGTATPQTTLDVVTGTSPTIRVMNSSSGGTATFQAATYGGATVANPANISLIRWRGSLGSPAVPQSGDQLGVINAYGGATPASWTPGLGAKILFTAEETFSSSASGAGIGFFTQANGGTNSMLERMHISNSGTVGIGLVSSSDGLQVKAKAGFGAAGITNGQISFYPANVANSYFHIENRNDNTLKFSAGASPGTTDLMTLTNAGFLGVGVDNPSVSIETNGSAKFGNASILSYAVDNVQFRSNFNPLTNKSIDSTKSTWMVVAGNASDQYAVYRAPATSGVLAEAQLFFVGGNGNAWLAGTLTQASDARLKRDVASIPDALNKVSALDGVTYHWKDASKDSQEQIGLIAQEVEKVFPQAVQTNPNGFKSVAYSNLIAPVINAVKELRDWLVQTDARVEKLESENAAMKSYLCAKDPVAPFCK